MNCVSDKNSQNANGLLSRVLATILTNFCGDILTDRTADRADAVFGTYNSLQLPPFGFRNK